MKWLVGFVSDHRPRNAPFPAHEPHPHPALHRLPHSLNKTWRIFSRDIVKRTSSTDENIWALFESLSDIAVCTKVLKIVLKAFVIVGVIVGVIVVDDVVMSLTC